MDNFTRPELWAIEEKARREASLVVNPAWSEAFTDLAKAASTLDAFIARSTVYPDGEKSRDRSSVLAVR